jgi:hypothetical protein
MLLHALLPFGLLARLSRRKRRRKSENSTRRPTNKQNGTTANSIRKRSVNDGSRTLRRKRTINERVALLMATRKLVPPQLPDHPLAVASIRIIDRRIRARYRQSYRLWRARSQPEPNLV